MKKKKGGKGKAKQNALLETKHAYEIDPGFLDRTGLTPRQARAAALIYWQEHGEQMEGVHIIGMWRNPEDKNPKHANWKTTDDPGQSLEDFYRTIHKDVLGEAIEISDEDLDDYAEQLDLFEDEEDIDEEIEEQEKEHKNRSEPMKRYHAAIRELRAKHPRLTYAQARTKYAKANKKPKRKAAKKKAKKKGRGKRK